MKLNKLTLLLLALFWLAQAYGQTNPAFALHIEDLNRSLSKPINERDIYIKNAENLIQPDEMAELKRLKKRYGFPSLSKVGVEQAHQFVMMVLQCNQDVHFQLRVLIQMEREMGKGEILKEDYALLKDRIHLNKNIPQIFGTQFILANESNTPEMFRIRNPELLEKRRLAMNLYDLPDPSTLSLLALNKN